MLEKPHFTEYVMARLVTIAVILFALFSVVLVMMIEERKILFLVLSLISFAFLLFIVAVYRGARQT